VIGSSAGGKVDRQEGRLLKPTSTLNPCLGAGADTGSLSLPWLWWSKYDCIYNTFALSGGAA